MQTGGHLKSAVVLLQDEEQKLNKDPALGKGAGIYISSVASSVAYDGASLFPHSRPPPVEPAEIRPRLYPQQSHSQRYYCITSTRELIPQINGGKCYTGVPPSPGCNQQYGLAEVVIPGSCQPVCSTF